MSGQADVIDRVPPQHLQVIAGSDNLTLSSVTGIESVNLWVKPGRFPLWDENPAFREAVVRSIDREGLVTGLVQGESAVATSFLPTKTLYHQEGDPAYTKDIEAAQALLAEAGVPDGGPEFELWVSPRRRGRCRHRRQYAGGGAESQDRDHRPGSHDRRHLH
jgi:peptide/nickel transport system substrate-binding protein